MKRWPSNRGPNAAKVAALEALFAAEINGNRGTPQHRLRIKAKKAVDDALLARVDKLDLLDLSKVYTQMTQGSKLADILEEMGVP
jgi:hypothetical protein